MAAVFELIVETGQGWVAPARRRFVPRRYIAPVRTALIIAAVPYVALYLADALMGGAGTDSHAYWTAWRDGVYSAAPGQKDAFLYSPAFAQGIWAFTLLPWSVFLAVWTMGSAGIYAWLLRPLGWRWGPLAFAFLVPAILIGNIWPLLAVVLVIGFRYPAAWAFPLLAKVTPAVGLVWFAARKQWRHLGIALVVAAIVAGVSYAVAPGLWSTWLQLLLHPTAFQNPARVSGSVRPVVGVPFAPRLVLAVMLTVYAARSDRRWLLPVCGALATPVFGAESFVVLAALPRIVARQTP